MASAPSDVPTTHWRCYEQRWPDPGAATALRAPVCAFPSWFFAMTCKRCEREVYRSQIDLRERLVGEIVARLRCERCRQAPDRVELVTGLSVHRYPIQRIALHPQ